MPLSSASEAADDEDDKLDQASGATANACPSASAYSESASTMKNDDDQGDDEDDDDDDDAGEDVQIDEDLFADDLDDIEEQLRETNMTS